MVKLITSNGEISNNYRAFIHKSRYARWQNDVGRRETWAETVARYVDFWVNRKQLDTDTAEEVYDAIINHEVMPSMRALMTAGEALDRDNVAGFNCSYLSIDRQRAFDELMYILMCGTGVGFSCETRYVSKLPIIAEEFHESDTVIVVSDSKIGWASSFRELISLLYAGKIPKWDLSKIRAAGEPLKTFGGRASGPAPLNDLFRYSVNLFRNAPGRKLTSIEVHGLVCKIAEIVVVGGVRRSALISLSDLADDRMRHAKSGQWWVEHPEFALANNSVAYDEKPSIETFMREWIAMVESKSGERGIFNRQAARNTAAKNGRRDTNHEFGTNPCSEIILRDRQFCNLSEVVIRPQDTPETLKEKVKIAAILGTLQSTLVDFRYLSKKWRDNTEEEALLGVSLTGIVDNQYTNGSMGPEVLEPLLDSLKKIAIETNAKWAKELGINPATAITAVKPSGTVSQLVDSASGIHPRYSPYYIRTVRADKKDPLAKFMIEAGFPVEDDVMKPDSTLVFSFPMKCDPNSVFRDDRSAMEQLRIWLSYQRFWCEHKPSVTIYVKENEWMEVGSWVYKHFNEVSGVSFLPHSDHSYQQAPYQEITEEQYYHLLAAMPEDIDWTKLSEYESSDMTEGSQTMACVGGACEIVDLTSE